MSISIKKLGLQALKIPRWYWRPFFFFEILKDMPPEYLQSYSNLVREQHCGMTSSQLTFKSAFFCFHTDECNNLIKNLKPLKRMLKVSILSSIKTKESSVFAVYDIEGMKLLSRLRLGFSLLNEHKFRHNVSLDLHCFCMLY